MFISFIVQELLCVHFQVPVANVSTKDCRQLLKHTFIEDFGDLEQFVPKQKSVIYEYVIFNKTSETQGN